MPLLLLQCLCKAQNIGASPLPVSIRQADGSSLSIIGQGTMFVHYTETSDGYVVVPNKKTIYEYALRDSSGNLIPSGRKAHDSKYRSRKEKAFLRKTGKHLTYNGAKMEELRKNIDNNKSDIQ